MESLQQAGGCHPWKCLLARLAAGWQLGTGPSEYSQFQLTDESDSLCLNYANHVVYAEQVLSFWKSGPLVHAGRGSLPGQPPIRMRVSGWLMSFPQALCVCCHSLLLEELILSCAFPLGEDSQKLVPCFLQTPFHELFPFDEFALCPFAVIKPSMSTTTFCTL